MQSCPNAVPKSNQNHLQRPKKTPHASFISVQYNAIASTLRRLLHLLYEIDLLDRMQ
jgi:hypothetical protein